jgi:hypothetical protein
MQHTILNFLLSPCSALSTSANLTSILETSTSLQTGTTSVSCYTSSKGPPVTPSRSESKSPATALRSSPGLKPGNRYHRGILNCTAITLQKPTPKPSMEVIHITGSWDITLAVSSALCGTRPTATWKIKEFKQSWPTAYPTGCQGLCISKLDKAGNSSAKTAMESGGRPVDSLPTLETKTRAVGRGLDTAEACSQLWVSQSRKLVAACHHNGLFDNVQLRDMTFELRQWELANQKVLGRLAYLLARIMKTVMDRDGSK